MTIETQEDVDALKRIGRIVSLTLQHMLDSAKPGMRTRELDQIGAAMLQAHGARSAPQLTYDFPGATCISINEEAAHGIPGDRIIGAGDVLNVDVSAELGGYFADTGGTVVVPPGTAQKTRLCHATRTALHEAMQCARAGQPINGIGAAIERTAKAVVEVETGHLRAARGERDGDMDGGGRLAGAALFVGKDDYVGRGGHAGSLLNDAPPLHRSGAGG